MVRIVFFLLIEAMINFFLPILTAMAISVGLVSSAWSEVRVEVSGVGITQIPIGIASFKGQDAAPQKPALIVASDLDRSGQFKTMDPGMVLDDTSRPDFAAIRQTNTDALVTGSIQKTADGRFEVKYRLWDVIKGQDLGGQSFLVVASDLRLVSHRIADQVYEKLTGDKGVFSTRIAYVTKQSQRHVLWVADADGENAQAALTSPEPIISPRWAPNGTDLAYVSFESRKPVVYVHDVSTGKPFATTSASPAYVPSSGARFEAEFGNAKNATTLTTNEAKTIAYNLLFKVVNFTLKSFIFALTISRSLIYGSSKTSVKPLGRADPDSESHTSHCHMDARQGKKV